ncbi:MAG: SDR family oxidoreductase [Planctomycetaceae bacterium]|nr:SDR family oxidoreductase [Planctomycetaceae bacterium]
MRDTRRSHWLLGLAATYLAYRLGQAAVRRARWFEWRHRVAIVTGGSRGLGLVLSRHLVEAGCRVFICARTADDVSAAVAELRSLGGDVDGVTCDVRNPAEVRQVVELAVTRWGRLDVLFNVAGIMQVGPLDAMTLDDFHEAMDINCWGALHTTLAVLPTMRQQRWGRIVNVGSIGGKRAVPHMIPYDTSKFALVGLSAGLRTELAQDGILVTTVNPSLMRTGSPRNATFKGQHRQEYTWFSLGGSLPLLSICADRAARQIMVACQQGESEVYIGNWLSPPVWAARLAPRLTTEVLSLVNRWLPAMGGIGQQAAYGYESESHLAPSWLTALGDAAARRNNELRPRDSLGNPLSEPEGSTS